MSRRFNETTIGDTIYRVEEDQMHRAFRVTAYTTLPGHAKRLGNSLSIRYCDVEAEMRDLGLDTKSHDQWLHCALTMGVSRLKPQIDYHRAQALGEDPLKRIFDPSDPDMDPDLADALVNGQLPKDWTVEDQRWQAEEEAERRAERAARMAQALREKEEREFQIAEAERIERERLQRERDQMETNELWGAF